LAQAHVESESIVPYDRTGTILGRNVDKRRERSRDRWNPHQHRRLATLLPSAYQKGNVLGTFRQEFVTQSLQYSKQSIPNKTKAQQVFKRLNLKFD